MASQASALRGFREIDDCLNALRLVQRHVLRLGQAHETNDIFTKTERRAFATLPSEDHPVDFRIRTYACSAKEARDGLLQGAFDYCHVVVTEVDETLFDFCEARRGHVHLVVDRAHPLAGRESVSIRDLKDVPMAMQPEGNDVGDLIRRQAAACGFAIDALVTCNGLHERVNMAQATQIKAATYGYHDGSYPHLAPDAVCVPFEESFMNWRYGVLTKKGQGDPFIVRYFAGLEVDWASLVEDLAAQESAAEGQ